MLFFFFSPDFAPFFGGVLFLIPRRKHAWRAARKWKLLLIRRNQILYGGRVSWNRNLELCQTSGWKRMLRRRDLESCSVHKWGQTCFGFTGYQKGFNERYFKPFPGFPHFFSPFAGTSQKQPSQASAYAARTFSCWEEKWGKSLVTPAAAIWENNP